MITQLVELTPPSASGRQLVFTTKASLDLLAESECWVMDGTFRSSPTHSHQIYSIHGFVGTQETGKFFPLLFALLPGQSEAVYTLFLEVSSVIAQLAEQLTLCRA